MVNNTGKNKITKTKYYQYMTELLHTHKARLESEIVLAKNQLKDKILRNDRQARTLLKVANIQLAVVKKQIQNDQAENVEAFNRGEINKFW